LEHFFAADTQAGLAELLTVETERRQKRTPAAKPWRVNSKSRHSSLRQT